MPINTRMAKSGLKKVQKKSRETIAGPLNRAARQISTGEARNLTPGVEGLRSPLDKRANRRSTEKQDIVRGTRRRHAPHEQLSKGRKP